MSAAVGSVERERLPILNPRKTVNVDSCLKLPRIGRLTTKNVAKVGDRPGRAQEDAASVAK